MGSVNQLQQNICEGLKDIDALSTACELVAIVLETVVPHIKAYFPQFHWREHKFVVRDSKWVDLSWDPNPQPYFYKDCLHASNRKGLKGTVFKPKQFMLFVVIPANQWEEFKTFWEKLRSSPPTHAWQISQAELVASSLPCLMVSTPVVTQRTMTSKPSMPLFLSKGVTSTTSSSAFDHQISQDILHLQEGNNVGLVTV